MIVSISNLIKTIGNVHNADPLAVNEYVEAEIVDTILSENDFDDEELELKLDEIMEEAFSTSLENAMAMVMA